MRRDDTQNIASTVNASWEASTWGNKPISKATVLTDRFDRALLYATHVHGGQIRKETSIPYIAHLLAVAAAVLEYGGDEDLAIAALLHDSVEDQGGKRRLDDVHNRFGERVARIVEGCSDSLADTGKGEPKADSKKRKEAYLAHLREADEDTLRVSLADKVHNARAILRDLRKPDIGDKVWSRFSQPKEKTIGYHRSLADVFCEQLPGQLSNELREIVEVLEAEGGAAGR
jgi:(p)ppGpp synthase/HD superfamily hydrolase